MTNITITYTKNSKGKFDFVAEQNGVKIYTKTYSPRVSEMQHKAIPKYISERTSYHEV